MTPLDRTRLEKALADHGFDLTMVLEGDSLQGRSTQHSDTVCLNLFYDGSIKIAVDNAKLCERNGVGD